MQSFCLLTTILHNVKFTVDTSSQQRKMLTHCKDAFPSFISHIGMSISSLSSKKTTGLKKLSLPEQLSSVMNQEFDLAHHFHPTSLFIVKQKRCMRFQKLRQHICIFQNFTIAKVQSTCTANSECICQEMLIYVNTQDTMNFMDRNEDFLIYQNTPSIILQTLRLIL